MTEAAFQRLIEESCKWLGLVVYHTHDSRRSNPGYPDLTIVGASGVLFRELKTDVGRLTADQKFWLEILSAAGQDAKVWRPRDMAVIQDELRALGRVAVEKAVKLPRRYRKKS